MENNNDKVMFVLLHEQIGFAVVKSYRAFQKIGRRIKRKIRPLIERVNHKIWMRLTREAAVVEREMNLLTGMGNTICMLQNKRLTPTPRVLRLGV